MIDRYGSFSRVDQFISNSTFEFRIPIPHPGSTHLLAIVRCSSYIPKEESMVTNAC